MGFDFSGLNSAVLDTFGDHQTLLLSGAAVPIEGAFRAPRLADQSAQYPVSYLEPQLDVRTADFAATGAKQGDRCRVGELEYTIARVYPDDGGMTRLVLKQYGDAICFR